MGFHWIPTVGAQLVVAETEVFSGNSPDPSAWTDLDLSAVVGVNHALVLLKAYNPWTSLQQFSFRINGETDETYALGAGFGCAMADVAVSTFCYFIIATDASGIIEWKYERANQPNVTIDVCAFIK